MLFLFLFLIVSCNSNQTSSHNHTLPEAHLETLSYTIYSDKTELFVEFKPLVLGNLSEFATHLTLIGDIYLPVTKGKVTVSLIVGENGIRHTGDSASSPGIFSLALIPKVSGTGKLVFDIETDRFKDQITIEPIEVYSDLNTALAKQVIVSIAGEISYLKEQAWKTEFANIPLTKKAIHEVIKTSGQIRSAPGDEIVLTASANGTLLFTKNGLIAGKQVNLGSNLFAISGGNNTHDNVNARYMEAKATYEKAKADFVRANELVKDKIVSDKEFLHTQLQYENAKTAYNTLTKNYSGKGQNISSPINGFIKQILVTEGQYVELGAPLALLSKNKNLILEVNVPQSYFSKLPSITSANFLLAGIPTVFNTKDLNAKVISFGKSASSNSPFIPISFEMDNTANFVPGAIVEVFLKADNIQNAYVVPISALIEEQGNFFVFVQTGGERFQKRTVKLGVNDGAQVQILSGVAEGERIVTKGAYQIKLAAASGALPAHGHEH